MTSSCVNACDHATVRLPFNVAWATAGNISAAVVQWLTLLAIVRIGTPELLGRFAAAIAVASPVIAFSMLQLRSLQATDVRNEFCFLDYFSLRVLTTLGALIFIIIIAGVLYPRSLLSLVVPVAIVKGLDAISDIFYGVQQQNEQMREIAISQMVRALGGACVAVIALYVSGSVTLMAYLLALVSLATLAFYDVPCGRRLTNLSPLPKSGRVAARGWPQRTIILRLARRSVPLGLVVMLSSLNVNAPRYFLERHYGDYTLGLFAAVAAIQVAGTTLVNAMGQSVTPRMAMLYASGSLRALRHIIGRFAGAALVLGLTGIAGSVVAGPAVLRAVLGPEYVGQKQTFILLSIASTIWYATSVLGYTATAVRVVTFQPVALAIVVAVTAVCCWLWVPSYGNRGAAIASLVGAGVACIMYLIPVATRIGLVSLSPGDCLAGSAVDGRIETRD